MYIYIYMDTWYLWIVYLICPLLSLRSNLMTWIFVVGNSPRAESSNEELKRENPSDQPGRPSWQRHLSTGWNIQRSEPNTFTNLLISSFTPGPSSISQVCNYLPITCATPCACANCKSLSKVLQSQRRIDLQEAKNWHHFSEMVPPNFHLK